MPKLANNELGGGFTHKKTITYNDLTDGDTAQTIGAIGIPQYGKVRDVQWYLETEFSGGSTSDLTVQVGDGTDPNGIIDAKNIHASSSTTSYSAQIDGAYFNDLTTDNVINSKYYATADTLDLTFTSTGGNLNTLTAGKIHVMADITDPVAYSQE